VEKIKRLGADGVKLMLWYRPDASNDVLDHQHALVRSVGDACRQHDIAFLVEPLVYPLGAAGSSDEADRYHEDPAKRPEMVLETLDELKKPEYGIDIFKLETPVPVDRVPDPDAAGAESRECQRWFDAIDARLDRPWVMLSAGAAMEPFRRVLTYAFRAGASGYLAGRAIWWPAFRDRYPDMDAFRAQVRAEGCRMSHESRSVAPLRTPGRSGPAFAARVRARTGPRSIL
jgi:tagatose 1,6-diphosphate aldolase